MDKKRALIINKKYQNSMFIRLILLKTAYQIILNQFIEAILVYMGNELI